MRNETVNTYVSFCGWARTSTKDCSWTLCHFIRISFTLYMQWIVSSCLPFVFGQLSVGKRTFIRWRVGVRAGMQKNWWYRTDSMQCMNIICNCIFMIFSLICRLRYELNKYLWFIWLHCNVMFGFGEACMIHLPLDKMTSYRHRYHSLSSFKIATDTNRH